MASIILVADTSQFIHIEMRIFDIVPAAIRVISIHFDVYFS